MSSLMGCGKEPLVHAMAVRLGERTSESDSRCTDAATDFVRDESAAVDRDTGARPTGHFIP
jgi:hypothetical protein